MVIAAALVAGLAFVTLEAVALIARLSFITQLTRGNARSDPLFQFFHVQQHFDFFLFFHTVSFPSAIGSPVLVRMADGPTGVSDSSPTSL